MPRCGPPGRSWGPDHRVFFSGDGGFTGAFSSIADRFGPFDLALVEIGQYDPSWGDIHMGPLGALQAHKLLRAKKLLPIHWGTFELALHAWSEPAETLTRAAQEQGVEILTPLRPADRANARRRDHRLVAGAASHRRPLPVSREGPPMGAHGAPSPRPTAAIARPVSRGAKSLASFAAAQRGCLARCLR